MLKLVRCVNILEDNRSGYRVHLEEDRELKPGEMNDEVPP